MNSGSLPVILSLLGLWVILFLFFAILFVEVFGMTKWNSEENATQNYTSMANALVMLRYVYRMGTMEAEAGLADMGYSSVVLWVSQNMEDDYTYNLAL